MQVDAAINHGNSGGLLFDAVGQVISVKTAFFAPDGAGGWVRLGFAIPSTDVVWMVDQIRRSHGVNPGSIDMQVQTVPREFVQAYGRTELGGAIIVALKPGSVAAKPGLLPDDIVLGIDTRPVTDVGARAWEVAKIPPGKIATMHIGRHGHATTLPVPTVESDGGDDMADMAVPMSAGRSTRECGCRISAFISFRCRRNCAINGISGRAKRTC